MVCGMMTTNEADGMGEAQRDTARPYPLRMDAVVKQIAQERAKKLDRSLNWVLNHELRKAFGLLQDPVEEVK